MGAGSYDGRARWCVGGRELMELLFAAEHIKPGAPPLEQAGGFFGIYTFYATQPLTMEKAHIVVDARASFSLPSPRD